MADGTTNINIGGAAGTAASGILGGPLGVAAGIASLGASIIGAISGAGQRAQAQSALNQAIQDIQAVGAPPNLAGQMLLQRFKQVGLYTPQLEQQIQLGVSKVSQIPTNTGLQQAQVNALQQLSQRAAGGLTATDRAAYNQLRGQTAAATQGAQQAALQQARSQGFNTQYGNQLQQELLAGQQGAQNLSAQGDQIAGQASQNALAALGQYQGAAANLNSQEFNQNLAKAQAADQFNVFNTQAQIARQQQNVAMQNQAQQQNLAQQQATSNQNVDVANQQLAAQLALQQQQWQSALGLAQAQNQPLYAQAGYSAQQAPQTAQQFQNIGQGLGGILNSIGVQNAQNPGTGQAIPAPSTTTASTAVAPYISTDELGNPLTPTQNYQNQTGTGATIS